MTCHPGSLRAIVETKRRQGAKSSATKSTNNGLIADGFLPFGVQDQPDPPRILN